MSGECFDLRSDEGSGQRNYAIKFKWILNDDLLLRNVVLMMTRKIVNSNSYI